MSKPKNRALYGGLTHSSYRKNRSKYWVIRCNGRLTWNAEDRSLPLTCLICWNKEQEYERVIFQR